MVFHYPKLSEVDLGIVRSPGPGLGNLLFPIARALIGQREFGGTFVHPTIRQFKVGTYLRGEKDKRTYGGVIRPRSGDEWRAWMQSVRAPKVEEGAPVAADGVTICYSGLRRQFHDIAGRCDLIGAWLRENTVRTDASSAPYDVALHVRQGDFQVASTEGAGRNVRQSFGWYRLALELARDLLAKRDAEIRLFTDGDARQVQRELDVEQLTVDASPNALASMNSMSRARVIVTSRSSFSMWAAFLGEMPAIWDSKMNLGEVFPARKGLDHFV